MAYSSDEERNLYIARAIGYISYAYGERLKGNNPKFEIRDDRVEKFAQALIAADAQRPKSIFAVDDEKKIMFSLDLGIVKDALKEAGLEYQFRNSAMVVIYPDQEFLRYAPYTNRFGECVDWAAFDLDPSYDGRWEDRRAKINDFEDGAQTMNCSEVLDEMFSQQFGYLVKIEPNSVPGADE